MDIYASHEYDQLLNIQCRWVDLNNELTTATFRLKRFLLKTIEIDKSLIHLKKKSIINHFCNAIDKLFKQIPGRRAKWFKINNSTEKIT